MRFLAVVCLAIAWNVLNCLCDSAGPPKPLDLSRLQSPHFRKCDLKDPTPTRSPCGVSGTLASVVPYSTGVVDYLQECRGACLQSSPQMGTGSEYPCKSFSFDKHSGLCQLYAMNARPYFQPDPTSSTTVWSFHCFNCPLDCSSSDKTKLVNTTNCVFSDAENRNSDGSFSLFENIDLVIGDMYVLSFEYKIISKNHTGKSTLQAAIGDLTYDDYLSRETQKGTHDSFVLVYNTFLANNKYNDYLQFYYIADNSSQKTVYLQNVKVYPAPRNLRTITEMVVNGNFETGSIRPWSIFIAQAKYKLISPGIHGRYALSVVNKKGFEDLGWEISQDFNAVVGTRYLAKFDYKTATPVTCTMLIDKSLYILPVNSGGNKTTTIRRVFTSSQVPSQLYLSFDSAKFSTSQVDILDGLSVRALT